MSHFRVCGGSEVWGETRQTILELVSSWPLLRLSCALGAKPKLRLCHGSIPLPAGGPYDAFGIAFCAEAFPDLTFLQVPPLAVGAT